MIVDCSMYLKKFYIGVGIFLIIPIQRTFFPVLEGVSEGLYILLGLIIFFTTMILIRPYAKCLEKNMKK